MKNLLKSLALVFVMVFGLCAFSACGKDNKTTPPPATEPQTLTETQVKTAFDNFGSAVLDVDGDFLAPEDETITEGYSKIGLEDSDFMPLTNDVTTSSNMNWYVSSFMYIVAIKDQDQIFDKAFQIPDSYSTTIVWVESATTEKIVVDMKVADSESSAANYSIMEFYLNSNATKITKAVIFGSDGTYIRAELDEQSKFTHIIVAPGFAGSSVVNITEHKVNQVVELNILAREGFVGNGFYQKDTGDKAEAIYEQLFTTDPATLETTIESNLAGKTLELLPVADE